MAKIKNFCDKKYVKLINEEGGGGPNKSRGSDFFSKKIKPGGGGGVYSGPKSILKENE